MSFEPIWGAPIAWYLFLAGLGGGAFVSSALLRKMHPEAKGAVRTAHAIAVIVVAVGLVLLMVDAKAGLHHPLRFALLLTNFGSVMTWGVVFLGLFELVAAIAFVLDLLKRNVPLWLEYAGAFLGLCVGAYTGALLGVCNTFPLWNSSLLPILFLVSAISTGMAAVLLACAIRYPDELRMIAKFKKLHNIFPAIEIVLIASLLFIAAGSGSAGAHSVESILSGSFSVLFWLGLILVGLVIPLLVEIWMLFFDDGDFEGSQAGRVLCGASSAGILVGGFLLRWIVVSAALPLSIVTAVL